VGIVNLQQVSLISPGRGLLI